MARTSTDPPANARLRDNVAGALRLAVSASRRDFIAVALLAAAGAVMPTLILLASKHVVDMIVAGAQAQRGIDYVLPGVLLLGGLAASQRIYSTLQSSRQYLFSRRVALEVERRFFEQSGRVDLGHFDNSDWHDRMSRARWDANWRSSSMSQAVVGLGGSCVQLIGMTGVLFSLHPALVLLAIASVLPTVSLQRRVNRRVYGFHYDWTPVQREEMYLGTLMAEPEKSKELRGFDLGSHFLTRWEKLSLDRFGRLRDLYVWAEKRSAFAAFLSGLCLAGAYGFVAVQGLAGLLTPGDLVLVIGAVAAITQQVGLVASTLVELDQHARFLNDYFSFLEIDTLVPAPDKARRRAIPSNPDVLFDDVTFTYPGGTEPALSGLTLHIEAGEMMALVGDNGAGKTSLVKLLLRYYDPQGGAVRLGGIDLRDFDPIELRRRIGVLFQDFVNYELRARDNVTFGRWENPVDDEAVRAALEAARAHDVVQKLPEGLDSNVGRLFEGGHDLSGGEWQRLALARLMYRDADLWILDEPTASLDPEAEAAIFSELRQALHGRIGLVISHRFSTVRIADRIAVLDAGRVIELGTHDELVANRGRYADLFNLQAAGYR